MASTASILKQKAREIAGVSVRTVDPDVQTASQRLAQIERDVSLLKRVLITSNDAMMVQAGRARQQMTDVLMGCAERLVTGAASEHYAKFKSVHDYMDTVLPAKLAEIFEKAVIKPLDEWFGALLELKKAFAELDAERVKYDHYKDKFVSLQEEKRQTQMKGKVFTKDAEERLSRNEQKLKEAEAAYNVIRDQWVARSAIAFEDAGFTMDMVLLRVMQYEKQAHADWNACTKAYEPSCASLLANAKSHKASLNKLTDRQGDVARLVSDAREKSGKLASLEAPTDTFGANAAFAAEGTSPPVGSAGVGGSSGPSSTRASAGGWDAGFGNEAGEAVAVAAPEREAGVAAVRAKPVVSPGNPFGTPSGSDAFTSNAKPTTGLPPKAPVTESAAVVAVASSKAADARKPSPGATGGHKSGFLGKMLGGNPFGPARAASPVPLAHVEQGEEGAPIQAESGVGKAKRASSATMALPGGEAADASSMGASAAGEWDDFSGAAHSSIASNGSHTNTHAQGGEPDPDSDPWGAAAKAVALNPAPKPAPVPKAASVTMGPWGSGPAASAGGGFGGFDDGFGTPAPAAAPRASVSAPAQDFGGFGDDFAAAPGGAAAFGGWEAPKPAPVAPAPRTAKSAAALDPFDPFDGM